MNRHRAIIENLGGAPRVASLLRMKEATVRKWMLRGIPGRHWHRLIALSPNLTAEYLDRTKPVGVQAKSRRYSAAAE